MICAYKPCKNKFEPKTHNQKYCSDECCRIATNEKLKEQYYRRKARKNGVKFKCKTRGCNQTLSPYDDEDVCGSCVSKQKQKERLDIVEMVKRVSG